MKPRVLIYEGFDGHGECLPPYYNYFKELGFEVDFVIKDRNYKEEALWMLPSDTNIYIINSEIVQKIHINTIHLKEVVKKVPKLFDYDFYFIATMNRRTFSFIKFLLNNGINRNQIMYLVHVDYAYYMAHTENNTSLLNGGFVIGFDEKFPRFPAVKNLTNCNKKYNITLKQDELKIFVSGLDHIHFANFEKFVKVAEEFNKKGKNIKINVTGVRRKEDYVLPESECVNYLGRLNFKDMSKEYMNNDYIMVFFDKDSDTYLEDHRAFLRGRVSGSRNMSIMYQVPLLVQDPFQKSWGLDDTNSISYKGNEYKELIQRLLDLKKEEYEKIINNLGEMQEKEVELGTRNLLDKVNFLKRKRNKKRIIKYLDNSSQEILE